MLLAQLSRDLPPADQPCDVVLATEVAARAAQQVLCHLDGELPATVDATWETALPDGRTRRRGWSQHPDCFCCD